MFMSLATATVAATCGLVGYLSHRFLSSEDQFQIIHLDTERNRYLVQECPTLREKMEYSYWTNGHFQTIYASLFRSGHKHEYWRESWSDIDLDWLQGKETKENAVLIITGLFGTCDSVYISGLAQELADEYDIAVLNFPTKISAPALWFNLREMIHETVQHIRSLGKYHQLYAIGFSNGGNSLVNYITMDDKDKKLDGIITVSQGFDASRSHQQLAGMYESVMASALCSIMNANQRTFRLDGPVKESSIVKIEKKTSCVALQTEDKEVYDIYDEYSSYHNFDKIQLPTLVLFSNDDPISSPDTVPLHAVLNPNVIFAISQMGGHIGWSEKNEKDGKVRINKICREFLAALRTFED